MECVAARNLAAMAFCVSPSSRLRLRKMWRRRTASGGHGVRWRSRLLKVEAKAGSESCVATKEDFADEDDYVKAGGSELVFVQMQQNKVMEMQSKIVDKVSCSLAHVSWILILVIFFLRLSIVMIGPERFPKFG
ncbi:hypothetical protein V8G54_006649 [Vigna mungo]|uniref:Uncharacterized protein n=1 Tax=Vigna mungo TaxID=3915 RepID=A0AAQ3P2J6_VIGMU